MTRSELIIVCGVSDSASQRVVDGIRGWDPAVTVVHHDLRGLSEGILRRAVESRDGVAQRYIELAHGCASCTLREDVLPLLHDLAVGGHGRIVLRLDPALEPEAVCWALHHVVVADGRGEECVLADVLDVSAVLTTVDLESWLEHATGDETVAECGLSAGVTDDRTMAQLSVGAVAFADALVLHGNETDPRTRPVLQRLAPSAAVTSLSTLDVPALLAAIPRSARRGVVDDPHGPLLRGQPSLHAENGVVLAHFQHRRPLHPKRLHDRLDVLLDGTVACWGRIWLASQPDTALWLESAGGGLRLGHIGPWLASEDTADADPLRQVMASLRWDPYYGDREQHLMLLCHDADPEVITAALHECLLTDAEISLGEQAMRALDDPFGDTHEEPCGDRVSEVDGPARGAGREA